MTERKFLPSCCPDCGCLLIGHDHTGKWVLNPKCVYDDLKCQKWLDENRKDYEDALKQETDGEL